ncbi:MULTISPECIES: pseudouridine synthase [Thermocrispum]|uniref:RNA pseudouridylate synthase n=1 Tax=Thermocrispum agreste TaxID=37925 RepID=A0ABD6FIE8_9PSEU|nr:MULTISPECIES: pseudouridine synthase [Thermocrispum]
MSKREASPLPQRDGLDAVRIVLPPAGPWRTVREYLHVRLSRLEPERIDAMLSQGRFVTADGPVATESPYRPGLSVWFHRELPEEKPVPFDVEILHRDEHIVVVHKPHFLATTPRGQHVMQTALVRVRQKLGLPELSPAHRLDRATAGVLLFVVRPELRSAYQKLFAQRLVHKEYEAIAPVRPDLTLPTVVRSRIVKRRGVLQAHEVPGEPNAETYVELLERRGDLGRYRLVPRTGRTHQLRVHLNALGIPIVGDPVYPHVRPSAWDDFSRPLQLLARTLAFIDPISKQERWFTSPASLSAWRETPERPTAAESR